MHTATLLLDRICQAIGIEPIQCQIYAGDPYLDNARNALVTEFLESDCTDLLFWDADVGAEPNAFARLVKARRPYIACLYPKKQDLLEFPVDFIDPSNVRGNEEGLVEVKMVPTGFLRLNRAVFDVMPHVDYPCNGKTYKGYFWTQITPTGYIGEDVMFAHMWRRLGGKIFVVPDINMWHTGKKTWHGNMHNWMMATFHRGEAELKEELEREVAKRQPGIKRGPFEGNPGEIRQGDAETSWESPQAAD